MQYEPADIHLELVEPDGSQPKMKQRTVQLSVLGGELRGNCSGGSWSTRLDYCEGGNARSSHDNSKIRQINHPAFCGDVMGVWSLRICVLSFGGAGETNIVTFIIS